MRIIIILVFFVLMIGRLPLSWADLGLSIDGVEISGDAGSEGIQDYGQGASVSEEIEFPENDPFSLNPFSSVPPDLENEFPELVDSSTEDLDELADGKQGAPPEGFEDVARGIASDGGGPGFLQNTADVAELVESWAGSGVNIVDDSGGDPHNHPNNPDRPESSDDFNPVDPYDLGDGDVLADGETVNAEPTKQNTKTSQNNEDPNRPESPDDFNPVDPLDLGDGDVLADGTHIPAETTGEPEFDDTELGDGDVLADGTRVPAGTKSQVTSQSHQEAFPNDPDF